MHRPKNPSSTLALTALIMAAGTTAHAQFNFMTDQPLNPSETSRRGARNDNSYYSGQRPIPAATAAPEPERKGFFSRLFSRDEAPSQTPQASSYAQPATTYTREGIRYSEPAGYQPAPAPAAAQWPAAQPVAPQYQPQTYANPQWPQQPAARPAGAVSSYPIGAEPVGGFAAPAPAPRPAAPVSSGQRAMPMDAFSGQRPARTEFAAPQPIAQPQWPQAQPAAPQFAPQNYPAQNWPATSARTIGSQANAPTVTSVVPPTGNARPLANHVVSDGVRYAPGAAPEGYPMPDARQAASTRETTIDRPGFFSRLFGLDRKRESDLAPAQSGPAPAQNYSPAAPQPDYNFRPQPTAAPAFAPTLAPAQDPFSGQRPARRANDFAPETPQPFPVPPAQGWPAPRSSVDSPPAAAPFALPAHLTPAEARAFSPLDA